MKNIHKNGVSKNEKKNEKGTNNEKSEQL